MVLNGEHPSEKASNGVIALLVLVSPGGSRSLEMIPSWHFKRPHGSGSPSRDIVFAASTA
jgi:hypothetical protein